MGSGSNETWLVAGAVFAGLLVVAALVFMVSEFIRFRRRNQPDYAGFISMRSTRRRISGSFLLIVLGLMLYFGLCVVDFRDSPVLFTVYWSISCLLAFILFFVGLLDLREVRDHRTAHQLKLLWRMTRHIQKK